MNFLKITFEIMKYSVTSHQKRTGNLDYYIDLVDKDLAGIKQIMITLKQNNQTAEQEKIRISLDMNWRRIRNIVRGKFVIPVNT